MAEQKFEEALEKLTDIVSDLEAGNLSLDDAIKKYEEGIKLSGFCYKKLNEIEKKVEVLIKDASGNIKSSELDDREITEQKKVEKATSKQKTGNKKKRPKGEELLF